METSRLLLKKIEGKHVYDIFEYSSNPKVSQFLLWDTHLTLENSENYVKFVHEGYARNRPEFGIFLKTNPEKMIGAIAAWWVSEIHKTMEVGVVLHEQHWGQGIVTEALKEMFEYCWKSYDVIRIQGRCKKENTQSHRMLEKCGMSYEGTLRANVFAKGESWDMEIFSLIRKQAPE
jgi:[ribosomal protein S5]-alanine N-acetyltransferase